MEVRIKEYQFESGRKRFAVEEKKRKTFLQLLVSIPDHWRILFLTFFVIWIFKRNYWFQIGEFDELEYANEFKKNRESEIVINKKIEEDLKKDNTVIGIKIH